MTSRSDWCIFP